HPHRRGKCRVDAARGGRGAGWLRQFRDASRGRRRRAGAAYPAGVGCGRPVRGATRHLSRMGKGQALLSLPCRDAGGRGGAQLRGNRRHWRADWRDGQPRRAGGDPRAGSLWRGQRGQAAALRPALHAFPHPYGAQGPGLSRLRGGTVRELRIIVACADSERLRAALVTASAQAALGGKAAVFLQLDAVALLRAPIAARLDDAHEAAGLPTLALLLEDAVALGVTLFACQSGLALSNLSASDLPKGVEMSGPVVFLQQTSDDAR